MNGFQRFIALLLCCFTVMILYPHFDSSGWRFMGLMLLLWSGVIFVLSVISNLLGVYNLRSFNRFIGFVLVCTIMYTLLSNFPQKDKVVPLLKIKYGQIPTKADVETGLKRFTFRFDFVRRNAFRDENFTNQELNKSPIKPAKTAPKLPESKLEITEQSQ